MKNTKSRIIFSIVAVICIAVYCAVITPKTLQNDTYYTVKIGQYLFENGIGDLTKDMYSWHNLPYTYPHWLYDLGTYLIYRVAAWDGIYIATIIQSIILGLSLFYVSTKLSKDEPISFAVTMAAMYMMKPYITARAQLITFILFVWGVYFIEKFLEKPKIGYALIIILIPLLITNLHCAVFPFYFVLFLPFIGEYVVALILDAHLILRGKKLVLSIFKKIRPKSKGIENVEKAIAELDQEIELKKEQQEAQKSKEPYKLVIKKNNAVLLLVIVMLIAGATGFLNPAGTGAYTYVYKTMQGNTTEHINEHLPLTPIDSMDFMISLGLFFGILMLTDRKIRLSDFFMFLGLTILALKMRRQVSMYVLFGTTIIARIIHSYFVKFDEKFEVKLTNVCASLICVVLLLILVGDVSYEEYKKKENDEYISEESYPVKVCDWILENCDVSKMKIYNEYNYGSYMLFRGIPVFIDSRCDLYTPEFNKTDDDPNGRDIFSDALNIASLYDNYETKFAAYGVTHVLIAPNTKLAVELEKDSNYEVLYHDDDSHFVLFKKR